MGGLPLTELNHLEIQFLILQDFNLMIPPAEIQFYADNLLRFWILEQQRQADKAFAAANAVHQAPDYKSPITPIVGGISSAPAPITYVPSHPSTTAYSSFEPHHTAQPMEGVETTSRRANSQDQ